MTGMQALRIVSELSDERLRELSPDELKELSESETTPKQIITGGDVEIADTIQIPTAYGYRIRRILSEIEQ